MARTGTIILSDVDKDAIIATLRRREAEFRRLGVESLSLFGSAARGDCSDESDVDLAVKLDHGRMPAGFAYAGRLEELRCMFEATLGRAVDVVPEPVRNRRFQEEIDRDRVLAF
jgi:predicted nucleotidyltransferase